MITNRAFTEKQFPLAVFGREDMQQVKAVLFAEGIWAEEVAAEAHYDGEIAGLPAESVLLLTFSGDERFCQEAPQE